MIAFHNEYTETLPFAERKTSQWIKNTALSYGKKVGRISYVFCSDDRILDVNKQFLQHDYYTDIITFDYSQQDVISGDIFISLDTVKTNAEKYGEAYERELYRVIIHGVLHLCGQKDETEEEYAEMKRKENLAIEEISF